MEEAMPRSLSDRVARLERNHVTRRKKRKPIDWLRHVNVIDFLENFDVANISQATADEVLYSCPFPGHVHGDENPSAYMNDGSKNPELTTLWKCHGCGRSGNAVGFVADHTNVSRQKAQNWIKKHYAPGYIAPKYGSIAREFEERRKRVKNVVIPELTPIDSGFLFVYEVDWDWEANMHIDDPEIAYLFDRGFTPAMLDEWGIGYDNWSDRLTFPVLDPDNNLVGFKGRAWRPGHKPKYLILGDKGAPRLRGYGFTPYLKQLAVFGLDKWGECEMYVIVEGEIDVMSLWVMDIPAICCGSSMSLEQSRIIRQYCDEVVIFLDNDTAGRNGTWGYNKPDGEHRPGMVELLEPFIRVRVVGRHRYDANEYLLRGERDRVRNLIDTAKASSWYDPAKRVRNSV
jgi:Toprim-like/DNA primase catalytic core, N-terminal domain